MSELDFLKSLMEVLDPYIILLQLKYKPDTSVSILKTELTRR